MLSFVCRGGRYYAGQLGQPSRHQTKTLSAWTNAAPLIPPLTLFIERHVEQQRVRGRLGPRVLAWDAEHRRHRVVAEGDERASMLPTRAGDVHRAMDDLIRGLSGSQGAYLGILR